MKRIPAPSQKLAPEQLREIEAAVFALAEESLDPKFYLLAVDFEKDAGYWYLRIYVEGRDFNIALNDCEAISRMLDPLLEEFPPLRDLTYSLEVSSPGLFRPLRTPREFGFYAGKPVRIEEKAAEDKKKPAPRPVLKPVEGILQAFDPERRKLTLLKPGSAESFEVSLAEDMAVCLNPEIHLPMDEECAK